VLAIEDAAGNETAVYGPTEFPRANGTNASTKAMLKMWFARGTRRLGTKISSRLGRRVVTRCILRNERGDVDTRSIQYAYRAVRPGPITSRATLRLNVVKRDGKLYHRR
jgi:hypothetical protein